MIGQVKGFSLRLLVIKNYLHHKLLDILIFQLPYFQILHQNIAVFILGSSGMQEMAT